MDRARERAKGERGEAIGSRAAGPAQKAGLWHRVARWVNLAWLASFVLYVASAVGLAKAGLLTLEHVATEPPMLLWPTLTATSLLMLAQLCVNGFDALVRLWDKEVGVPSIGLIVLGPCTGGATSFVDWLFVGRRALDDGRASPRT